MAAAPAPTRGEIWLIDFDPAVGAEIRKLRPAVVVRVEAVGKLPLRLVVPVTDWKPQYAAYPWFTELPPTPANGLVKHSGADSFQVKSISLSRFNRPVGRVSLAQLEEIASAVAMCVGAT